MIKRPKNTDSEQDLLKMQLEYMKEKERDANFQPAAKVIKMGPPEKKQSEFAKRRGLTTTSEGRGIKSASTSDNVILGEIVERSEQMEIDVPVAKPMIEAFPKVDKVNPDAVPVKGMSLFAQMRSGTTTEEITNPQPADFGNRSFVVSGSDAEQIHKQNADVLAGMSNEDLQRERDKLMQSIDPSLMDFLKKMRAPQQSTSKETPKSQAEKPKSGTPYVVPELAKVGRESSWVNFNQIEDEKLEWMKDVSVNVPQPKDGEEYEARFDWKGTLLPFKDLSTDDNRELYLHGDEPHRPGYTLQELFRLSRSDVLQQRVSALTAVQGILAIYNQGFYDQVLELPISKIFFLLRFSLDDKAIPVMEQAILGLANLFYNASDEFLLDCLFDTKLGRREPVFQDAKKRMQLEYSFKKMSVSNSYKTSLDDGDENEVGSEDANMNDFQMAETDLVKCLLRTNIIERIQYLFNVMQPGSETKIKESCVKILIRLARYGPDGIEKITENYNLIDGLIDSVQDEEAPRLHTLIVKLFRMIIGYSIVAELNVPLIMDLGKKIIFNRNNLNTPMIRLQVEAFRLLRVCIADRRYQDSYSDFVPAIRYLFEWHYKFLDITDNRSALVQQHVSAMVALLSHKVFCFDRNMCTEIMVLCFRKWLTIFKSSVDSGQVLEMGFSQNLLFCIIMEFCGDHKVLYQSVQDLCTKLVTCPAFQQNILRPLSTNSSILKISSDRSEVLPQLPNFGAVAFDANNKVSLIIPQSSSVIMVNSMLQLFIKHERSVLNQLQAEPFNEVLINFTTHPKLVGIMKRNWFCRHDLDFIFTIIQSGICKDIALVLKVTGIFVSCLRVRSHIEHLLQDIFFNPAMYKNKLNYHDGELMMWKDVYMQYYLMRQSTAETAEDSLLPAKWPYEILNIFYEQHVESKDKKKISFNIEKETEDRLIRVSMGMTTLLEANGVFLVSPTDRLIHLMMAFLSPECRFVDASVKECLMERALFMKQNISLDSPFQFKNETFDFDSFYTVLLNQFQSAGYADKLFSAMVMVPLATQYDVKWKKMVWSEHVAVLRFISCADDELVFNTFSDFVTERKGTDDPNYELSLLKSYNSALHSKQLRIDSIPYKIAQFFLKNK